ncbi:hypothetical protein ACRAR1_01125 [Streptomyces sanyensis]|uniref:hypothetical protein n=1 Tax=Streptomyces sanyensis TaxID=568869 RepID=UPI003D77D734
MNQGHAAFCDADRHFDDAPRRVSRPGAEAARHALAERPVPEGRERREHGDRPALQPTDHRLPAAPSTTRCARRTG